MNKNDLFGYSGSGMGKFKRGKQLTAIADFKEGDLIVCVSRQFKAVNVARVSKRHLEDNNDKACATFVDPNDPLKSRCAGDSEFVIWDFHLYSDVHDIYYRAVRNSRPIRSPRGFRRHLASCLAGRIKTLNGSPIRNTQSLERVAEKAQRAFDRRHYKAAERWVGVLLRS